MNIYIYIYTFDNRIYIKYVVVFFFTKSLAILSDTTRKKIENFAIMKLIFSSNETETETETETERRLYLALFHTLLPAGH